MNIQANDIAQWAGYITAGLLASAYTLQKYLKGWRETGASSDVVKLLHSEIIRMSEQNTKLMTEINLLQTQIVTLNQQLTDLQSENQKLNAQVTQLTEEIARLQLVIPKDSAIHTGV